MTSRGDATDAHRARLRTPLRRALLLLVGAALAGAFVFGVWHVVVGGLVSGNPRAAAFGTALAAAAGVALAVGVRIVRPGGWPRPPG